MKFEFGVLKFEVGVLKVEVGVLKFEVGVLKVDVGVLNVVPIEPPELFEPPDARMGPPFVPEPVPGSVVVVEPNGGLKTEVGTLNPNPGFAKPTELLKPVAKLLLKLVGAWPNPMKPLPNPLLKPFPKLDTELPNSEDALLGKDGVFDPLTPVKVFRVPPRF